MKYAKVYYVTMKNFPGVAEIAANDEEGARKRINKLYPEVKIKSIEYSHKNKKKED